MYEKKTGLSVVGFTKKINGAAAADLVLHILVHAYVHVDRGFKVWNLDVF